MFVTAPWRVQLRVGNFAFGHLLTALWVGSAFELCRFPEVEKYALRGYFFMFTFFRRRKRIPVLDHPYGSPTDRGDQGNEEN
jgi:hypothetical protein